MRGEGRTRVRQEEMDQGGGRCGEVVRMRGAGQGGPARWMRVQSHEGKTCGRGVEWISETSHKHGDREE